MYAKISKCDFYERKIQYLGHIIFEEGITMDSKKIEATMEWPTPRNAMDVRYFMGLVGHYRRSIK